MYVVSYRRELISLLIVFMITKFDILIKIIFCLFNFKIYNSKLYDLQIQK